jgi:broad specificity phosphatase PhoE
MAAQLIHVVRHAAAGDRASWPVDDDLRPLSERGCGQAERLIGLLGSPPPAVVYASPSLRCIATVLPLARANRLPLTTLQELYEGGSAAAMMARLSAEARSPVVASTHGDIVEDLLGMLIAAGIALQSHRAEKGSTWTLQLADGRVTSARYAPPP